MLFAFAMGFILKAVGPALVMQLMFELQSKRLGTDRSESTPHFDRACPIDAVTSMCRAKSHARSASDEGGMSSSCNYTQITVRCMCCGLYCRSAGDGGGGLQL